MTREEMCAQMYIAAYAAAMPREGQVILYDDNNASRMWNAEDTDKRARLAVANFRAGVGVDR